MKKINSCLLLLIIIFFGFGVSVKKSLAIEKVATPTSSLAGGVYYSNQVVTLSSNTAGAQIYYTLDGQTTPTSASTLYTGPIVITEYNSVALWAVAIKDGMSDSDVAFFSYTIMTTPRGLESFSPEDILNDISHDFMSIVGADPLNTSKATFNVAYVMQSSVLSANIPAGTEVTRTGGGNLDITTLSSQDVTAQYNNLSEGYDAPGIIHFGIPNLNLTFSNPITLSINVGSQNEGKKFNVYYKNEGESAWTVQTTCNVTGGLCSFTTSHATDFSSGEKAPGTRDEKKKEVIKPRTITQSKKTVKNGSTFVQRGKKFSKNTVVKLYFSKYGGGYYEPMEIKTTKSGSFSVSYKANKQKGTYKWYAVDSKTGKKSRTLIYHIK